MAKWRRSTSCERALGVPSDRVIYVGDGSSDIHVMLDVNIGGGLTIAASAAEYITQIAKRTIISDDALSVLVPILEQIGGWSPERIRDLFETHGVLIQQWDKVRTDWLTIGESSMAAEPAAPASDEGAQDQE